MREDVKYIIYGSSWDLYKYSFSDIINLSNVEYISDSFIINNLFFRFLFSYKLRKYFPLPKISFFNPYLIKGSYDKEFPIRFIFFSNWVRINSYTNFIYTLKKRYPNAKFIWFLQDLYKFNKYPIDPFDLVLSYDKNDCDNYKFLYHPTVYSISNFESDNCRYQSDVYFLGKFKGRLDLLVALYSYLSKNGFSCDFNVLGVPPNLQVYPDKIHYLSKPITYLENLQHIKKTKCILELIQPGAEGSTFRIWESISYKKKLITNNSSIRNESYYNSTFVKVLENNCFDNILSFVSANDNVVFPDPSFMSPVNFLNYIETEL